MAYAPDEKPRRRSLLNTSPQPHATHGELLVYIVLRKISTLHALKKWTAVSTLRRGRAYLLTVFSEGDGTPNALLTAPLHAYFFLKILRLWATIGIGCHESVGGF